MDIAVKRLLLAAKITGVIVEAVVGTALLCDPGDHAIYGVFLWVISNPLGSTSSVGPSARCQRELRAAGPPAAIGFAVCRCLRGGILPDDSRDLHWGLSRSSGSLRRRGASGDFRLRACGHGQCGCRDLDDLAVIRVAIATSRNVCGRLALNPTAPDAIMCVQLQLMWLDSSDFFYAKQQYATRHGIACPAAI